MSNGNLHVRGEAAEAPPQLEIVLELEGELSAVELHQLFAGCRIHRTLDGGLEIRLAGGPEAST